MHFPIVFMRPSHSYDIASPFVNFVGNSLVVAGVSSLAAVISYLSLKALGINAVTIATFTAIPVTLGAIGIASAVAGTLALGALVIAVINAFSNR